MRYLFGDSHARNLSKLNFFPALGEPIFVKGGATTHDIKKSIKNNRVQIKNFADGIILLVGTNDLIKGLPIVQIISNLKSIFRFLLGLKPDIKINIVEIFISPKIIERGLGRKVCQLNLFLESCQRENVRVIGINYFVKGHFFKDKIHFSDFGNKILGRVIETESI